MKEKPTREILSNTKVASIQKSTREKICDFPKKGNNFSQMLCSSQASFMFK
jgi:hypothetical protein